MAGNLYICTIKKTKMSKKYKLHLKGYVGGWDFDADYVQYVLNQNDGKDVDVLIDSLGGRTDTALTIAAAFARHGKVACHFVGMNASAATIASMGAKSVTIDRHAMYLVHKCSTPVIKIKMMNSDQIADLVKELKKEHENLNKIDANIAAMYAERCKKTAKELLSLMEKGGWLTAEEALEWGFVDALTSDADDRQAKVTAAVAADMSAAGIPVAGLDVEGKGGMAEWLENALKSFFGANVEKTNAETVAEAVKEPSSEVEAKPASPGTPSPKRATILAPKLCAALGVDCLEMPADGAEASITVEQIAKAEAYIARLMEAPGDTTSDVVAVPSSAKADENAPSECDDAYTAYVKSVRRAEKMFNELN